MPAPALIDVGAIIGAIPEKRLRRPLRLAGFDYSRAGAYSVTICARNRQCLFGELSNGRMRYSRTGDTVDSCWNEIRSHFTNVILDAFVLMPNHLHAILVLADRSGEPSRSPLVSLKIGGPQPGYFPVM